ncbi:hypothetical protein [Nonomuraea sp. NPDC002799]
MQLESYVAFGISSIDWTVFSLVKADKLVQRAELESNTMLQWQVAKAILTACQEDD